MNKRGRHDHLTALQRSRLDQMLRQGIPTAVLCAQFNLRPRSIQLRAKKIGVALKMGPPTAQERGRRDRLMQLLA